MFIKKHFRRILPGLIISLISVVFLLTLSVSPALAGEVSLNTKISVKLSEPQSGNPGKFINLILELKIRDDLPLVMEAVWNSAAVLPPPAK